MSVSQIPAKVKYKLWARAAGRCEYEGCNQPLWEDIVSKAQFSTAYIAHIVAERPGGARYHPQESQLLKFAFSNLLLLCDAHHRLIDVADVEGHSVERLRDMKRRHEERIRLQTAPVDDRQSHILHYGANVGTHAAFITWEKSREAMLPTHYPADSRAIDISLQNSPFEDSESSYWKLERENLLRQFSSKVNPRLGNDIKHLSVFAIAPQPLLMELGRLLSDISGIEVYQHQREPRDNWSWTSQGESIEYQVERPSVFSKTVAVNLSLSASIDNARITSVLGETVSIWTLTIADPHNDCLKSRSELQMFRQCFRSLLNEIKLLHGQTLRAMCFALWNCCTSLKWTWRCLSWMTQWPENC